METYHISLRQFCQSYDLKEDFVLNFMEMELIQLRPVEGELFIADEHLGTLERMARLHKDLGINEAGLETIHHLLERIEQLHDEMRALKNKLRLYEDL